jgi:hypothetical protein
MMTSHARRVNALMRFHGLTKAEAETRAKNLERTGKKTNPKKRSNKKHAIIGRPSQITRKKPTARLVARRKKNLRAPKGVFPNPKSVHVDIDVNSHNAKGRRSRTRVNPRKPKYHVDIVAGGAWRRQATFSVKPMAIEYAKALDRKHGHTKTIRVVAA